MRKIAKRRPKIEMQGERVEKRRDRNNCHMQKNVQNKTAYIGGESHEMRRDKENETEGEESRKSEKENDRDLSQVSNSM